MFRLPKTALGKSLKSAEYPFLLPVTLSETNVERMLIQVLERMVKEGKTSSPYRGDQDPAYKLEELVEKLSKNQKLDGFDNERGRVLLDGWLRTSVLEMIPKKEGPGDQIDFVKLLTIASYRSGLSRERSRHRKADLLIYKAMIKSKKHEIGFDKASLRMMLQKTKLTDGLDFSDATLYPYISPEYDEKSPLDINALLELRFLEGIEGRNPVRKDDDLTFTMPVPEAVVPLATDMLNLITSFSNLAPSQAIDGLTAIMSLRLFQLPLRVVHAINNLEAQNGVSVDQPDVRNTCEMYFDFTSSATSLSSELSKKSVESDLQTLGSLFSKLVQLRETENCLRAIKPVKEAYELLDPRAKLIKLIEMRKDPQVHLVAGLEITKIESALEEDENLSDLVDVLNEIRSSSTDDLEAYARLVVEDHGNVALAGYRKWSYSTGGFMPNGGRRDYALLSGTKSKPVTWKYKMGDSLLVTLINLCFLDDKGILQKRRHLEMSELLQRLESRFGVLINRPPRELDSPEARAAAVENFAAFTRNLKVLGYFEGLSDDFAAQYVTRPDFEGLKND